MRAILRLFLWTVAIILIAVGAIVWWFVYRPLPRLDGSIDLPGLQKNVIVERDHWGVPHIRANSVEDMVEAQGYVMAQDRLWQMDLLRRVARGQLSEILGPVTLNVDKQFRTLGFARAADRDLGLMDPASRAIFEAYARGVNHFIEQHRDQLPIEFSLLKYKPQPWQPTDTLVISGYMYQTLTDTWEDELDRAKVTDRVGWERARDLFSPDAAMDHFVVGDPNVVNDGSQRSRVDPDDDDDDDDDMEPDGVLKASAHHPGDGSRRLSHKQCRDIRLRPRSDLRIGNFGLRLSRGLEPRDSPQPRQQQLGRQRRPHRHRKAAARQRHPPRTIHPADLVRNPPDRSRLERERFHACPAHRSS